MFSPSNGTETGDQKDPQVFQQNFQAQENQDHAPQGLGLGLHPGTAETAELDPQAGEQEGGQSDTADGRQNIHLQKGEGNAHRQRVNAGGHRHGEHDPEAQGSAGLLRVAASGFPEHVDPQNRQQGEGDPVVDGGDVQGKPGAQEPAQQGHEPLESSEP